MCKYNGSYVCIFSRLLLIYRQVEKDNILKANYMILEAVVDYLNGTYVTSFYSNFGLSHDENDLFLKDSMMGDVQRGKADVAGEL